MSVEILTKRCVGRQGMVQRMIRRRSSQGFAGFSEGAKIRWAQNDQIAVHPRRRWYRYVYLRTYGRHQRTNMPKVKSEVIRAQAL